MPSTVNARASVPMLAAVFTSLSLAGCAQWVRPGATVVQRDAAVARCQAIAYRQAPERDITVKTSSGGWTEGDKHCEKIDGKRSCYRDDAYYKQPTYGTKDVNASARDSFVNQCMYSAGWHLE